MQPFEEIERNYEQPDPWGYQTNEDDQKRKRTIIEVATFFGPYQRCLDIGAGEGWITKDYPAKELHGYEYSNNAAARFPETVKRVVVPIGKYDLVCATGVMYGHYNWPFFMQLIKDHSSKYVLVSSIDAWELPCVNDIGKEIYRTQYDYREWKQRTRMFKLT